VGVQASELLDGKVIHMTTSPDKPPKQEPAPAPCVQPHKRCTWLPILGGVLCGMIVLCLFAKNEPSVFSRLTAWAINEAPPVKIIEPRTVHFTLFMLTLAAIGGSIGVLYSEWRKRTAFLFLLAILVVIAVFNALGSYLEPMWH
jgi:hypothetical protein